MKQELKPSVRINIEAKKKLEDIQSKTHRSQTALLDRAVELLVHEVLAKQMLDDIADLSNDPTAMAKYIAISDIFEQASGDGLRKE
jgi:predicted DNA-binding protein